MNTINRLVAIIKPKQPLLDWLESLPDWDDELTLDEIRADCTAILIPEYGSNEKALQYIEQKHEEIFEIELSNWHYDEDLWTKNRSLKIFREWFDIEIHSMVYDAVDENIIKED
ncbi:MAG: hypothetical protein AAB116_06385 [Candidatus Poribacteria bacterium]|mgnify:FL=1